MSLPCTIARRSLALLPALAGLFLLVAQAARAEPVRGSLPAEDVYRLWLGSVARTNTRSDIYREVTFLPDGEVRASRQLKDAVSAGDVSVVRTRLLPDLSGCVPLEGRDGFFACGFTTRTAVQYVTVPRNQVQFDPFVGDAFSNAWDAVLERPMTTSISTYVAKVDPDDRDGNGYPYRLIGFYPDTGRQRNRTNPYYKFTTYPEPKVFRRKPLEVCLAGDCERFGRPGHPREVTGGCRLGSAFSDSRLVRIGRPRGLTRASCPARWRCRQG